MNPELLRQYLEYYQDLGVHTLYRRAPVTVAAAPEPAEAVPEPPPPPPSLLEQLPPVIQPAPPAPALLFTEPEPVAVADDTLAGIREDIGDCRRCRLCEGRQKIVFGTGNESARIVFVGEGPGADEDATGIPFVGRAGQLLTQMIENTARREGITLQRGDVYICNVVKCRPPENRTPLPDEMATCSPFLFRQLETIRPDVIVTLGGTAAGGLLQVKEGVTKIRGRWFDWRGIPVMVTYHPSYLLRDPNVNAKREAWEDLKAVYERVFGAKPS